MNAVHTRSAGWKERIVRNSSMMPGMPFFNDASNHSLTTGGIVFILLDGTLRVDGDLVGLRDGFELATDLSIDLPDIADDEQFFLMSGDSRRAVLLDELVFLMSWSS